ncbi:DHS-like NAD/FAD-binding domain-containing protein [Pluteus cervinus]|uniref:DHS-like NAD/FAD-binding domain-containing protein n=1 Tax=Pluteus cervinus TaxID=181527 RepID=A0ACD3AS40_9AGAR|nr:DHS-like NAD/FAD-binding domain-containing protein [Pluteus cervinus]
MWRSLKAMSLATPTAFEADPSLVWQFYHYRRVKALEASPNAAHRVLAKLSIPSVLKSIAPQAQSYHLITQNVDGLSTRAINALIPQTQPPSPSPSPETLPNPNSLIEMHGRLLDIQCTQCSYLQQNLLNPLTPSLGIAESQISNVNEAGSKPSEIPLDELPRCPECGALARPGVVWFEEIPWEMDRIDKLVEEADVCLVVGTSSTVYPAAGYAYEVYNRGGTVAVFNVEESRGDVYSSFVFYGPCDMELPRVLGVSGD